MENDERDYTPHTLCVFIWDALTPARLCFILEPTEDHLPEVSPTRPITAAYFNWFIIQPENRERSFELIGGEIVEEMVSSPRSSVIANWIMSRVTIFVDEHDLGYVRGRWQLCRIRRRYIPDGAFISKERCPAMPNEAYNPIAPNLALEVLSPTNTDEDTRVKVSNYLAAGTVAWVVDPRKWVEVHQPGQPVQVLVDGDTLDGGDKLPGFRLPLSDVIDLE